MSEAAGFFGSHILRTRRRPRLPVIDTQGLRIAQLADRAQFERARPFPAVRWDELTRFAPNILIGSASELRRLIERMDLRTLDLSCVDHAVFALTELGDRPVTDVLRVVLWQRFGVPVYEVYMGPRDELLAAECEAQDGWHVQARTRFIAEGGQLMYSNNRERLIPTGLAGDLVFATCACGRPGSRILLQRRSSIGCEEPLLAATA